MSTPVMDPLVRVINEGDEPFSKACRGQVFKLAPGEEAMWPADIATSLFGHPELRGGDRDQEWRGILTFYGVYEDRVSAWDEIRPRIGVFSLTGDRYPMVAEDPTGETLPALSAAPLAPELQALIDQKVREAIEAALPTDDGVPTQRARRSA